MSEGGERTEAPTQKRKNDALKKGDVLRSKEFATALVMLVGVAWMVMAGPSLVRACAQVMATSFRFGRSDVEDFSPFRPLFEAGTALLPSLLILFAVTLAAAVVSGLAMGSGAFNASLFAPKASRINPASGLKRIFGMNGWIELGKNLVKVVLLGVIGGWMLWKSRASTMGLAASDLNTALGQLGDTFLGVMIAMAGGLALIAAGDLPIQIIRRLAKLRMTKQEVKDEHKESEGNPEHKAHARAFARKLLSGGARKAVMEAHVVLTNPTHFAVALRYDRGKDQVPVVVAKGRGATALAIRELAGEAKVPVLEYPLLARAVYYTSREGQEIRDDLYRAIATVLAFVFGLNERARDTHGGDMPMVEVPIGARFDENGAVIR